MKHLKTVEHYILKDLGSRFCRKSMFSLLNIYLITQHPVDSLDNILADNASFVLPWRWSAQRQPAYR